MHVIEDDIHGYRSRALALRVVVKTDVESSELSQVRFRVGGLLEKTGMTPVDTEDGVFVDVIVPASEMSMPKGIYTWELLAQHEGEDVTIGTGQFKVDSAPTEAPSE